MRFHSSEVPYYVQILGDPSKGDAYKQLAQTLRLLRVGSTGEVRKSGDCGEAVTLGHSHAHTLRISSAMDFFSDIAGGNPYKPSLFELVAQEQLRDLLQPALKYVLTVRRRRSAGYTALPSTSN